MASAAPPACSLLGDGVMDDTLLCIASFLTAATDLLRLLNQSKCEITIWFVNALYKYPSRLPTTDGMPPTALGVFYEHLLTTS